MTPPESRGRADLVEGRTLLAELHALPKDDPRRAPLRDRLVTMHMPLAAYLARRFANRAEPLDDLIQVGTIGLIKAIDRFDPGRGLEFSTFATPTILGEIRRHFRDTGWLVRVPRRAQELQASLNAARAELTQQLGRSPTVAELAQRLHVEPDVVLEALDAARAYSGVPLDVLVPSGETVPDHPALGITELGFDQVEDRTALRTALARLPQQEREVLALRFLAHKSQSEIATMIGVSQMQISRIVARSLKSLRSALEEPESR